MKTQPTATAPEALTPPVNGAPATETASPQAGPPAPKMVKVSKRTAAALRVGIEAGNAAMAAVRSAEDRLQLARQTLQSVAGTNQGYVVALIEDAGHKPEDFANFGIWEQDGEMYIRATPQQQ